MLPFMVSYFNVLRYTKRGDVMKILMLGDLHFGVKQDDAWMQDVQRLLIKQAIEYSKEHGIKQWLQGGDWFDVRKAVTHRTMLFNREIAENIQNNGIKVNVCVGNHDATFKNTLTPNACNELLGQFDNFTIHDKPETLKFDGVSIDMIPWICEDNKDYILDFIKNSKSDYCMGHFELNGFKFYKDVDSHGEDPIFLSKYKHVWAGHFHCISHNKNVTYLGTPYTITGGDENDKRGFWIFDTETEKVEFVPNDTIWHKSIHYPSELTKFDEFKNLSVRLFVTKIDKNLTKFEDALESIVYDLKVVSKIDNTVDTIKDEEIEIKSVLDLMYEWIDCVDNLNTDEVSVIKNMTKKLYLEIK